VLYPLSYEDLFS